MATYLNGHSNAVGGVLITNDDVLAARLAFQGWAS